MELVAALNREEGITVVMVLHDMNHAARYSDELILLNRSKVHTIGAPRELLENGELENVFSVEAEILSDSEDIRLYFMQRGKNNEIYFYNRFRPCPEKSDESGKGDNEP